jgi:AAA+ superfamily predicted ATPase
MYELEQWPRENGEFLTRAVEWLRYKLMYLACGHPPRAELSAPLVPAQAEHATITHRRWWFFRWGRPPAPPPLPDLNRGIHSMHVTAADVRAKEEAMHRAAAIDPPPALMILQHRFGLCDFERFVILLCAAMELDTRIPGLCAQAQDNPARQYPTFALAYAMRDDAPWSALAPDGKLRYWRLIEINQPGSTPLMSAALRADEKIVNYLKGINHPDERLEPLLEPMAEGTGRLPDSHERLVLDIASHVRASPGFQHLPVYQLIGPDPVSKEMVAAGVCEALGVQLFRLPLAVLPTQASEVETFTRLWRREAALAPRGLYVDAHEIDGQLPALQRFTARARGLVFCALRDHQPDLGRESVARDVFKPTVAEQQSEWEVMLGDEAGDAPGLLAGQFSLHVTEIRRLAREALAQQHGGSAGLTERLWAACLAGTRPRLDVLAQRIEPKVKLEDVVLPKEQSETLARIADQVRNRSRVYDGWGFRAQMSRGLGISALFAGDSGTGKTMAAEALAHDLRLNLYRIDLSAVVNKYIGETEKNLRRLFDAAEDGGAILFFDEADALFGKRSEVKDSHDRYANIEVNYLLQRLESYGGLAILATNMKSALDAGFTRRLRFIVTFPFPSQKEREAIWRKVFPAHTPVSNDMDYARLSRLNLTGANIQSIAMNAAFLAARAGKDSVSMRYVLEAARAEFRKFDWPVNEADFRVAEPAGAKR